MEDWGEMSLTNPPPTRIMAVGKYEQHTIGRHCRSCLDDTVGQAISLMVDAASSEARQFGQHTRGPRGCDRLR
jgi:hypothetical protein